MKKLSLILCVAMCLCVMNFEMNAEENLVDSGIDYKDSTETISTNPEIGVVALSGWTVCSKSGNTVVLNPTGAYNTVMYDLRAFSAGNDYRNSSFSPSASVGGEDIPISSKTLESIRKTLENARKNAASMTLRFAYAWDDACGNEPADFNMILTHIDQLCEVINDYADIVVSIEAGMVGPWGEMHSSKYASGEYVKQILARWLDNLDESITVQARQPMHILAYYGMKRSQFMASIPLEDKNFPRLGMYNDGYLGTVTDYGTFDDQSDSTLDREQGKVFLNALDYVPYGGEIAHVSRDFALKNSILYKDYNIVEEFYLTHLSYLRNIAYEGHVIANCMRELKFTDKYDFEGMPDLSEYYGINLNKFTTDHMGYRFVLRQSLLNDSVAPGGELHLVGKIENTGFGNILKDKKTEILLYRKGAYYSCPIKLNAKTDLKSCTVYDYDIKLVLPKNIIPGKYEVFMRISADNTDLSRELDFSIAFANEGVYQSSIGANKIGAFDVSGDAVSENEFLHERDNEENGTSVPVVVAGNRTTATAYLGQTVTLGYFVQGVTDIKYTVNGKEIETKDGKASFAMTCETAGDCYAYYTTKAGSSASAKFLTLSVAGHNYVETSRQEPTCFEPGKIIYTCTDCDDTQFVDIPYIPHDYEHIITDEKCFSQCRICQHTTVIQAYDKDSFDEKTRYNVYFCDENGNVLCHKTGDYQEGITVESLYSGDTPTKTDEIYSYEFVGWKDVNGGTADEALGLMILVPEFESECMHKHKDVKHIPEECETDGYYFEKCLDCQTVLQEYTVPMTGHCFSQEWTVDKEPTDTKPGVKCHACVNCGKKADITPIAPLKTPEQRFHDVYKTSWFYDAVDYAITNSLFSGMSETAFEPDTPMTRAMLVRVLYNIEGAPDTSKYRNDFADVPDNEWYTEAVKWASAMGIVYGTSDTEFSPADNLTRQDLAVIIYRYANIKGYDTAARKNLDEFPDYYMSAKYAKDALSWAAAVQIISGNNIDGKVKLDPKGMATRAQVAMVLKNFCQKVK